MGPVVQCNNLCNRESTFNASHVYSTALHLNATPPYHFMHQWLRLCLWTYHAHARHGLHCIKYFPTELRQLQYIAVRNSPDHPLALTVHNKMWSQHYPLQTLAMNPLSTVLTLFGRVCVHSISPRLSIVVYSLHRI